MNERQSDYELLQAFVRQGEQAAFAQVARRHLDLVYGTALRRVQEPGAAQEVAQNVFATLARKAWQFAPDDSVPAWLYRAALLEGREWLRGELRRRRREQAAAELGTTMKTPDDQPALRALVPMLDEALLSLREKDRAALLLRFYETRSLRDVGTALGIGEDAARKRVAAALDRLTDYFQRRGYKTATASAAVAALEHTAICAPPAVANAVVLAAGQVAPPALAGLVSLLARIGGWSKVQTAMICLALSAAPVAWEWHAHQRALADLVELRYRSDSGQSELSDALVRIDRVNAEASRLTNALAAAEAAAQDRVEAIRKFDAWRSRLRAQLTGADYHWLDDSPFVRIPKSVLPHLEVYQPVTPVGNIKLAARELLGLTPEERQRIENTLKDFFAAGDALIEASIRETNRAIRISIPRSAVASRVWTVPALGEELRLRSGTLQAELQDILGQERWPLAKTALENAGDSSLRRLMDPIEGAAEQEVGVWLTSSGERWMIGSGWARGQTTIGTSGLALDLFRTATPDQLPEVSCFDDLPDCISKRIRLWLVQQASERLGKEEL
jgi:RNA polymerase sigma factor (sigma-70 family)